MNLRPIPFVRLLIPLIVGIVLQEMTQLELFNWRSVLFLASLIIPIFILSNKRIQRKHRWFFGLITNLLLIFIGMGLHFFHQENNQPLHFRCQANQEIIFLGTIKEMTPKGKNYQIIFKISQMGTDTLTQARGRLLAYIPMDTLCRGMGIGDTILAKAYIAPASKPLNPKVFDFSKYLHTQNIHYTAYIKEGKWQKINHSTPFSILGLSRKIQNKCLEILKKHLPSEREGSVASALILGYKPGLDKETKAAYANTGAMHVLAVSGLHTGFIYLMVMLLLRKIPFRHQLTTPLKTLILIWSLWMFALITGAAPSVLRSATMFSFIAIGKAIKREASIYNTLAGSAFCLLVIDPFLIFAPGFQLSYLAVASIVYFQPLIYRLWYSPRKSIDYFWQLISVSFAAQTGTFPLSLYYFHKIPLYFWLSGIIVVPAAGFILPLGLTLFALDQVPVLGRLIGKLLYYTVLCMNHLIFKLQELPGNLISDLWIDPLTLALITACIICLIYIIEKRKAGSIIFLGALIVLLSCKNMVQTYSQLFQRNITVYHNKNGSIIDFFDGTKVYSLTTFEPKDNRLTYATLGHQQFRSVRSQQYIKSDSIFFRQGNIRLHEGYIQFFDKHLYCLNGQSGLPPQKTKIDFLIISGNSKQAPNSVMKWLECSSLILDGSTSYRQRKRWMDWCHENHLKYWDCSQQGAFIFNF